MKNIQGNEKREKNAVEEYRIRYKKNYFWWEKIGKIKQYWKII